MSLKEPQRIEASDQSPPPKKRPLTEAEKEADYKKRAMEALNRAGVSVDAPTSDKKAKVIQEQEYVPPPNFEELKEQALAKSLARSESIANELKPVGTPK